MQCPNCGFESDSNYCPMCGTEIPEKPVLENSAYQNIPYSSHPDKNFNTNYSAQPPVSVFPEEQQAFSAPNGRETASDLSSFNLPLQPQKNFYTENNTVHSKRTDKTYVTVLEILAVCLIVIVIAAGAVINIISPALYEKQQEKMLSDKALSSKSYVPDAYSADNYSSSIIGGTAEGNIFKYTDENGIYHYTDFDTYLMNETVFVPCGNMTLIDKTSEAIPDSDLDKNLTSSEEYKLHIKYGFTFKIVNDTDKAIELEFPEMSFSDMDEQYMFDHSWSYLCDESKISIPAQSSKNITLYGILHSNENFDSIDLNLQINNYSSDKSNDLREVYRLEFCA